MSIKRFTANQSSLTPSILKRNHQKACRENNRWTVTLPNSVSSRWPRNSAGKSSSCIICMFSERFCAYFTCSFCCRNNEKYEEFVLSTTDYSYFVVKGGKEFKTIGDLVRNYSMSELPCNTASGNGSTGIKLLFPVSNPHLSRKNVFEKNVFDAGEYLNPTEMRAAFERNSTKTIESSEDTAENDGLGERINSSNDTPVIDDSDTLAHKEVRDSNVDPAVGGTGQGSTSSSDDAGQKMVCTNDIYSEVTSYPIHEKELPHGWRVRFEVGREIQFVSPKGEIHSDLPTRITLSLSSEQQDWIKRLFRDSETELTEVNNPVEE